MDVRDIIRARQKYIQGLGYENDDGVRLGDSVAPDAIGSGDVSYVATDQPQGEDGDRSVDAEYLSNARSTDEQRAMAIFQEDQAIDDEGGESPSSAAQKVNTTDILSRYWSPAARQFNDRGMGEQAEIDLPDVAPQTTDGVDVGGPAWNVAADMARGVLVDSPRAMALGFMSALDDMYNFFSDINNFMMGGIGKFNEAVGIGTEEQLMSMWGSPRIDINKNIIGRLPILGDLTEGDGLDDPESVTGGIIKEMTRFLIPFGLGSKLAGGVKVVDSLVKSGKAGRMAVDAAVGAVVDFVQTPEPNMANLLQKVPALNGPVLEALEYDGDNTEWMNRLRNAAIGVVPGVAADMLVYGVRAMRLQRIEKARLAELAPDVDKAKIRKIIKTHSGDVIELGDDSLSDEQFNILSDIMNQSEEMVTIRAANDEWLERGGRDMVSKEELDEIASRVEIFSYPRAPQRLAAAREALGQEFDSVTQLVKEMRGMIDYQTVKDYLDPDDAKALVRRLGAGYFKRGEKGGMHVDEVGAAFGFENPDDIIDFLRNAPTKKELDAKVDEYIETEWLGGMSDEAFGLEVKEENLRAGNILLKKYGQDINVGQLTPEKIQEIIYSFADILKKQPTITQGQTVEGALKSLSGDMGLSVRTLLKRNPTMAANHQELMASRILLSLSAQNLFRAARRASVDPSSGTRWAFERLFMGHYAIQRQVMNMTSEAGRALNSLRYPIPGVEATSRHMTEFLGELDLMRGKLTTERLAKMVLDMEKPGQLNGFVRHGQKSWFGRWITAPMLEVYVNGLLSNPATQMVNISGNMITTASQVPERYMAHWVGRLLGDVSVEQREAVEMIPGLLRGAADGVLAAGKVLTAARRADIEVIKRAVKGRSSLDETWNAVKNIGKEGDIGDVATKLEIKRSGANAISDEQMNISGPLAPMVDLLGQIVNLPGRGLLAGDALFKAIGFRGELRTRAYRLANQEAVSQGMDGVVKADFIAAKMQDIMTDPDSYKDIYKAARDNAAYVTFTNALGPAGRMIQSIPSYMPGLRVFFPFIRTPINIAKYAFERTPLAPLTKTFRDNIAAGGARRDLAVAKMMLGSVVMASFADLTMEGYITGAGPLEAHTRELLRNTGWKPYSIKVGDTYVGYSRFDPIAGLVGMAADLTEIIAQLDDGDGEKIALAMAMAVANSFSSKTYLKGLVEMAGAFREQVLFGQDPSRDAQTPVGKWADSMVQSFTPAILRAIRREEDPVMRQVRGMVDTAKARVFGMSKDYPPSLNMWGEVVYYAPGLWMGAVSPTFTSKVDNDPVNQEVYRVGIKSQRISRRFGNIRLDDQRYNELAKLAGNELKLPVEAVAEKLGLDSIGSGSLGCKDFVRLMITKSVAYSGFATDWKLAEPEKMQASIIDAAIQIYRSEARKEMMRRHKDLLADRVYGKFINRGYDPNAIGVSLDLQAGGY